MAQINKSSDYFNTKLYAGNGSTQSITGVGFQPDWTWIKGRSGTYGVSNHKVYDVVRGATETLFVNLTNAETTQTNTLTSFDSDGFSLGNDSNVNDGSTNYASWNWYTGATASSNTDGSITSTVSANTTSGFSIVSYTGTGSVATVGHGLGSAPKMIIVKRLDSAEAWPVDCRQLGGTLYLNETGTLQSYADASPFPSTAPTSTVFSVGSAPNGNASGSPMIAYCFAEKKGFSKFGSYTGNGSTDGTFVYTGFKPALFIAKKTSAIGYWSISDNKRLGYNPENKRLYPNSSDSEETFAYDFLSNGVKLRNTTDTNNGSGGTYIYMAFASEPLVGSNNVPATAR